MKKKIFKKQTSATPTTARSGTIASTGVAGDRPSASTTATATSRTLGASPAKSYKFLDKTDNGKFFWSATPCAFPPPWPSIFSDYSFRVHHLVNRDDRHLLAHAMASDFSVTKRTIVFSLRIKLHAPDNCNYKY
jgi:hypothetical protein